jgi:hypothetical protein
MAETQITWWGHGRKFNYPRGGEVILESPTPGSGHGGKSNPLWAAIRESPWAQPFFLFR